MKLMYKINLIAVFVIIGVGLSLTMAAMTTISRVTYDLNHDVMSQKLENVISIMQNAVSEIQINSLEGIESYKLQAQFDVLEKLNDFRYRKTGDLMIVTGQEKIVKHRTLEKGEDSDIKKVSKMINYQSGATEFVYDGQQRFFSFTYFQQWDWLIILSISSEEMLASRSQFLTHVIIIILVWLVLGGLLFTWLTKRTDPID